MLKVGIIGLPNVGKSSLFNALTNAKVLAANYPFATIDPNVGVVNVIDPRLDFLEEVYQTKKKIYTTIEFVDIAGLVKGASAGEGLGNQFLSHIRNCDALCHVVRGFDDELITHVSGKIDPISDYETIIYELKLSDLDVVEKRIKRLAKGVKARVKTDMDENDVLVKVRDKIYNEESLVLKDFNEEEQKLLKSFNLLSFKPMIVVANLSEEGLMNPSQDKYFKMITDRALIDDVLVVPSSSNLESELASLDKEEQEEYISTYKIETSLNKIILSSYFILGLETFFTAGVQEARAWTYKKGSTAYDAAGVIHTDFQRGFIRAEVLGYDDLVKYGSYIKCKEAGRLRLEGKDYVVKDGDIMLFRFNV